MKSSMIPYALLCVLTTLWATAAAETQSPLCSQKCLYPVLTALPCYSNTSTSQELADCFCPNVLAQASVNTCVESQCDAADLYAAGKLGQAWCSGQPVESHSNELVIAASLLLFFVTVFVGLRVWSRSITGYKVGWDDWTLGIATIAVLAFLAIEFPNAQAGTGDHMWNVDPDAASELLKIFYVLKLVYIVAQVFTKLSLVCFYLRIFPHEWVRIASWAMLIWLIGHGVIFFFLEAFECRPIQAFWDSSIAGECRNETVIYYLGAATSIFEDIFILALPIPCIASLNMGIGKKFLVCFVFALGSFASVASIVRLTALHAYITGTDATWEGLDLAVWSSVEVATAVICACLPTLRPLLTRYIPKLFGGEVSSNSYSDGINANYPRSFRLRLDDVEAAPSSEFGKLSSKASTQISSIETTHKFRQQSSATDDEDETKLVPLPLKPIDLNGMGIVKTTELTVMDTKRASETREQPQAMEKSDPYEWEISYSRRQPMVSDSTL